MSEEKEVEAKDEEECEVAEEINVLEEQKKLIDMVNKNDMDSIEKHLAADAVIRSVVEADKSAIGRDKVMVKLREIGSKLKGKLGNREVVQLDAKKSRCICKASVFGTSVVIGFEFVFAGAIVLELGLGKNPPSDFLSVPKEAEKKEESVAIESLVPRPKVFPPRFVRFIVKRLDGPLISPYKIPRPINPYVRVACGSVVARTKAKVNTKTPDFEGHLLEFIAPSETDTLDITILDKNVGRKSQWLARGQFHLPQLKVCEPPEPVSIQLDVRLSALSQQVKPDTKITLFAEVSDIYMERWWTLEERIKRAELAESQEDDSSSAATTSDAEKAATSKRSWWNLWSA